MKVSANITEMMILALPPTRRQDLKPEHLRLLADQLEQALAEGYYVSSDITVWDPQGGCNYPETLTRAGGKDVDLQIHLGRLRWIEQGTNEAEQD